MTLPISPALIASPVSLTAPLLKPQTAATGFADLLNTAITAVETSQNVAKVATEDLLLGGKGEIHEVALAGQRAELSLELFQQVRNKLVQAYQEVMRMPM